MALPLAYRTTRITISGVLSGGAEEWSTGFWFGAASEDAALPDQALADGVRDAWRTFFTATTSYISNSWTTTTVKCSSFGTDGKSDANDTVYSNFEPVATGANSNQFPPQVALVATLTSNVARGLASKGRMYLPGVVIPMVTGGRMNSTQRAALALNFKTFLDAVNALPHNNVVLNASHGQLNANGTPKLGGYGPVSKAVQGIKVGDVYDTQRRRRNGIQELYNVRALA